MLVAPRVKQIFLRVIAARTPIVGAFLLLTVAGIYGALRIPTDSSIDRLIVAGDPTAQATQAFEKVFPPAEQALILLEAAQPLSQEVLQGADALERALDAIPHVAAHSILTLFYRSQAPATINAEDAARIKSFATGTSMFRRSSLLGDHYLGIGVELRVVSPAERDAALAAIDALVLPLDAAGKPFSAVRRVGSPWLDAWLERQTGASTKKSMPLFGAFLMVLVFVVFRSWRALAAIILTLGAVVAVAVGLGDLFGFSNSVVSTLVPLTVMVTATATLVYIHSRYMLPNGIEDEREHHGAALANKFLPCTASMFATAVGFAALAVSDIRPVREMGLWTSAGLIVAWVGCFTLFPALQSLLRAPRLTSSSSEGKWFAALVDFLVPFTRRHRWLLVSLALVVMLCGAAALFGIPGRLAPLALETDALTYVNPHERVAMDTRRFEENSGLDVDDLWLHTQPDHALDPEFLRAVEVLTRKLEQQRGIDSVDGPTSVLRFVRYIQSGSDQLPNAPEAWPKLAEDLQQILLTEPNARNYVDITNLSSVRLSIRGRGELFGPAGAMRRFVLATWAEVQRSEPALRDVQGELAGQGVLSGTITERLLPTLMQSFAITASVIFLAFLVVFRSPSARLMTMIPSFFAILSVFIVMRLVGIPLNIATILIGSTILGATENDQVHFFYHLQEGREGLAHPSGSRSTAATESALRHAMLTAGRPILFATLINTSGFLALALSDLPPMRQFGTVSASAFALALLADFSALPAALWILSRDPKD
jgi:predicted RND superfamily exporter protein